MDDKRRKTLMALGGAIATGGVGAAGTSIDRARVRADIGPEAGEPPSSSVDGQRDIIAATDFIKGDGATNNDAGLSALKNLVSQRHASGNAVLVIWPAGRYVFTVMPNWAINCLHMRFEGEVWLINVGAGDGLTFDGGATGTGVYGLQITGFPRIYGAAGSRNGIYARSIYRSTFEINCRGAGTASSGFHGEWLVSNAIHFIMNFNEGGLYNTPARGMLLTTRGDNPRLQSSYNNLYDPEFSGLPKGLVLDGALGNKLFGGALQGNVLGAELTANAWANKFFGADFESNRTDVLDRGRTTQFYGCDFEKGPVLARTSRSACVMGGETNMIRVEDGADRALISGVTYNRFGTGGIEDAGVLTRRRDLRNAQGGGIENMPRRQTTLNPERSPFTYVNATAGNQAVLIQGGDVTRLYLRRDTDLSMPTSGQYVLGPGDGIRIDFDGRPPALAVWTL